VRAPTTSIILVAYGDGDRLARCLESVAAHAPDAEVIVVDNGGDAAELKHATVVSTDNNLGFAAGCNVGASHARGEVLLFLNPDTVLTAGALASLERVLDDPGIGIAMPRLRLLGEPDLLNSAGNVLHLTGLAWVGGYGEKASDVTELRDVPYATGAALAIHAETFRELGGFREELFLYHEDVDLGWRAHMRGLRVVVVPDADVLHDYEFARNARKSYYLERNRLVFVASAFSARLLLLLAPVLAAAEVALCVRALREGWLREKLAGWIWCVRNGRLLLRIRRETQRRRRIPDRELVHFLTPVLDPAVVARSRFVDAVNPLVAGYWALARRAL
jgi:GT2 family glycosyltransferase